AGPVVWRAQQRRLPTVLQEQNAFPGLATRWLARRARQVHLGFPEARERLRVGPHTAVFALGNPIRTPEPGSRDAALVDFGLAPERPTLLVFGGSQGAQAINYAVAGALERRLLDGINVVWGTRPRRTAPPRARRRKAPAPARRAGCERPRRPASGRRARRAPRAPFGRARSPPSRRTARSAPGRCGWRRRARGAPRPI